MSINQIIETKEFIYIIQHPETPSEEPISFSEKVMVVMDKEIKTLKSMADDYVKWNEDANFKIIKAKKDIKSLADNLKCAGEVIKRTNNELGKAYKELANKLLKEGL